MREQQQEHGNEKVQQECINGSAVRAVGRMQ